jgi:hypothetical protein
MAKLGLIALGMLSFYLLSLIPAQAQQCNEFWICMDWSFCTGSGVQIRSCTDINRCGTEKLKPAETQSCTPMAVKEIVLPEQPADTGITGLLVSNAPTILGVVALTLFIVAYVMYRKWKDIRAFVSGP